MPSVGVERKRYRSTSVANTSREICLTASGVAGRVKPSALAVLYR